MEELQLLFIYNYYNFLNFKEEKSIISYTYIHFQSKDGDSFFNQKNHIYKKNSSFVNIDDINN